MVTAFGMEIWYKVVGGMKLCVQVLQPIKKRYWAPTVCQHNAKSWETGIILKKLESSDDSWLPYWRMNCGDCKKLIFSLLGRGYVRTASKTLIIPTGRKRYSRQRELNTKAWEKTWEEVSEVGPWEVWETTNRKCARTREGTAKGEEVDMQWEKVGWDQIV